MAVGVKLLHLKLVSDNNLIKVVHVICIVPVSDVLATKVYWFLIVLSVPRKRFFSADPGCLNSLVN